MTSLDTFLAALGHPVRRRALAILRSDGEKCLCELMDVLGCAQSGMSRHMAALKRAGLVRDRRDAQWVRYRLADLRPEAAAIVDAVLAAERGADAPAACLSILQTHQGKVSRP